MAVAEAESPPRQRTYSDEQRATALAAVDANGGNVWRTSQQLGIPRKTLEDWHRGRRLQGSAHGAAVAALRQQKRDDLSDQLNDIAWVAAKVVQDDLPLSSARDAAVCLGIAVENMQRLRGLPTVIVGHMDARLSKLNDDQLDTIEKWLADADAKTCRDVDVTSATDSPLSPVGRQTVDGNVERARDGRGAPQGRSATAAEQPTDGPLGETAAARQLDGPDALVGQDGAQPRGKRVGGR